MSPAEIARAAACVLAHGGAEITADRPMAHGRYVAVLCDARGEVERQAGIPVIVEIDGEQQGSFVREDR